MAKFNFTKDNILEALKYIDKSGVPNEHESTKYVLVTESGKAYPPKYVLAVADHIVNGMPIKTDGFNAVEAKNFLQRLCFKIENKKFILTVTAKDVVSTDLRFTMNDLGLGDKYKAVDAYLERANDEIVRRERAKNENRISNKTMPKIACQVFEKELDGLSDSEKKEFPICQYSLNGGIVKGIYSSLSEYKKDHRHTMVYFTYEYDNGRQFVFEYWNLFSTLKFVQECLKRFGKPNDKFILVYCEKEKNEEGVVDEEAENSADNAQGENNQSTQGTADGIVYLNPYSVDLIDCKNIIFRGAPGTGKTYLARAIAADIVSDGEVNDYNSLTEEQKKRIGFVQFHPSYDYTDFVEGLRPKKNDDGSMGFELKDGLFKEFVERARKNYENSQKTSAVIKKELLVKEAVEDFLSNINLGEDTFSTISGNTFTITEVDDNHIYVSIPSNAIVNKLSLSLDDIIKMLESDVTFDKIKDIKDFFGKAHYVQAYSYYLAIYKAIKAKIKTNVAIHVEKEKRKNYVFIIDEINRGEISKIFGELFFSVDPGYRGENGAVSTQYANLHSDPNEKFYIPENVYIIGTMNDIDRSVETFDFAMRRRFRFIEISAKESMQMLEQLIEPLKTEAKNRMTALNDVIAEEDDLNENYQIGAAYYLKLNSLSFDELWNDYLEPLLKDYVQGIYGSNSIMQKFKDAYFNGGLANSGVWKTVFTEAVESGVTGDEGYANEDPQD